MPALLHSSLSRLASLAAAAAVALAVITASATPARADDDLRRFLAGAAGLVVLYAILDNNRRAQAAPPHRGGWNPPRHGRAAVLPARCAVDVRVRGGGSQTFYGERCLRQAGLNTRQLPARCEVTLRNRQGQRTAFSEACLVRAGYRVQGGRGGRHW
jgi:hypothetical protein